METEPQLVQVWFPTADDVERLTVIDKLVYGKNALAVKQWQKLLVRPSAIVLALAVKHPLPVAFAVIECHLKYNEILRLVVSPDYQRTGFGSLMVKLLGEQNPLEIRMHERNSAGLAFAKKNKFMAIRLNRGEFLDGDEIVLWRERDPNSEKNTNSP